MTIFTFLIGICISGNFDMPTEITLSKSLTLSILETATFKKEKELTMLTEQSDLIKLSLK